MCVCVCLPRCLKREREREGGGGREGGKRENIESGHCLSIMLRVQVSSRRIKPIFKMHCVSFHDIYCIVVYRLNMLESNYRVIRPRGVPNPVIAKHRFRSL